MIRIPVLFSLIIASTFNVWGQSPAEDLALYKKKYPTTSRVRVLDSYDITIDFDTKERDSIVITNVRDIQDYYTDKHAVRFSQRSVQSTYFEQVTEIEPYVEYPKNEKKYKKEKVKEIETKKELSQQFFYDDLETMSFEYPNLREGTKSYLTYTTVLKTPELISPCFFGNIYPIEKKVYKVTHHKDIFIDFRKFNGIEDITTYTKTTDGDYITHSWIAKDLDRLEFEYSSPSFSATTPHIYPIVNYYMKEGKKVNVLENLDALHDWYTELLLLSDVEESEELKKLVDTLTASSSTELQKVEKIYDWVQKRVKYIAYEDGLGGFVPRPPQLVFDRMYGDCKDMAFLMVKMMEYAGIEGYVSWVGTRSKPYTYDELPSPGCDNHMIATYKSTDGKWYFLDATGTYTPFGYPSQFIQGKEVLVHMDKGKYELVKVDFVPENKNVEYDSVWVSIDGRSLKGNGVAGFSGYEYSDLEHSILDRDSLTQVKILRSFLEKGSNKFFFELDAINFDKNDNGTITYDFTIEDYITSTSSATYVNLNLEKILSESKIEDDRKSSFENEYVKEIHRVFILDLEGKYTIENLPKDFSFGEEGTDGFAIKYEVKDGKIIYSLDIYLRNIYLGKEGFENWNNMIKSLNKKYKEVITLSAK